MTWNCSDPVLLSRMLSAVAAEAGDLGAAIAWLGEQVSAGADIVALQSFDFLAQQAHAQGALIALLAAMADGAADRHVLAAGVAKVPLPAMRSRLTLALGGPAEQGDDEDGTVIWLEGA